MCPCLEKKLFKSKCLTLRIKLSFLFLFATPFYANAKKDDMQKIETPNFKIGFDEKSKTMAQRTANILETIRKPLSNSLGSPPHRMRILLENKSMVSNGSFSPMPHHILLYTFYLSDPHFVGNSDWFTLLCTHEFRHAVQYNIQYHSIPFWLRPLYAWSGIIHFIGVPRFFSEGDAVAMETVYSKSGRGRMPAWERLYKVNLLERGNTSYGKQLFGSYAHPIPDEYHLGYYFTTYIRKHYGAKALATIYAKTLHGLPYLGFYHAIKQATKKTVLQLYKEMNQELFLTWTNQLAGLHITPAISMVIKNNHADHCDYTHPFIDESGNIIVWKEGIGTRSQLVRLEPIAHMLPSNKNELLYKEKRLIFLEGKPFEASATIGKTVWLENYLDPWRGQQLNKQNIYRIRLQQYDCKRNKRKTLIKNCKYNAVAISPNGNQLVAVELEDTFNHQLVVIDANNGKVLKKISNPEGVYYLTPSWYDATSILVVQTKDQKNSIVRIDTMTDKVEVLLPYCHEHRSSPLLYDEKYLLYNSSINGIDNIYAMHLPTKNCFQVTSRKYGAYLGMIDPATNQLIFNDYTKNGMKIVKMDFDPLLWTPLEQVQDLSSAYYQPLLAQENNTDIVQTIPQNTYPTSTYRLIRDDWAWTGGKISDLNFKTWGAKVIPFEWTNLGSSLQISPYIHHNFQPKKHDKARSQTHPKGNHTELGVSMQYYTCYPIIEAKVCTFRELQPKLKPNWAYKVGFNVQLPYYFSLGASSGTVAFSTAASIKKAQTTASSEQQVYLKHKLAFNHTSTKSHRDIHAPWSQNVSIHVKYPTMLFSDPKTKKQALKLNCTTCFPGLGSHHYIGVHTNYSYEKLTQKYLSTQNNSSIKSMRIIPRYGLPLAYVDSGIPLLFFIKSIYIEGYLMYDIRKQHHELDIKGFKMPLPRSFEHHPTKWGIKLHALGNLLSISASSISYNVSWGCFLKKTKQDTWVVVWKNLPTIEMKY